MRTATRAMLVAITALLGPGAPPHVRAEAPTTVPSTAPPSTVAGTPSAEAPVAEAPATHAPASEPSYRELVARAHALWTARPSLGTLEENACIKAWQEGDRVKTLLDDAVPPPKYAAYHAALQACMTASLATSDECLVQPGGGANWRTYLQEAWKECMAIGDVVQREKLDLPHAW